MDDLVQRLRLLGNFGHDNHSTAHDAADAIERLTAERDSLSLAYKTSEDDVFNLTQKVIPNLRAERDALSRNLKLAEVKLRGRAHPASEPRDPPECLATLGFWPDCGCGECYAIHCLSDALGKIDALQAKLDALMMECCPDAMTDEQRARWGSDELEAAQQ